MKFIRLTAASAVVLAMATALFHGQAFAQPSTINFDVPGPADWNTASNWVIPNVVDLFVPGDGFPDEIVGISNGGIVELNAQALFPVSGVVIGETHDPSIPNPMEEEGTLNISGAGSLTVTGSGAAGAASFRIGDAGKGVLNMNGGVLLAESLQLAGTADSALNLSGNAVLSVTNGINLGRIMTIRGPDVVVDVEGDLTMSGTYSPIITGPNHSAISVTVGTANVGGAVRVAFDGHIPGFGDVWTLVDANALTSTAAIDPASAALPRGLAYDLQNTNGELRLSVDNRLILSVNRRTGVASIENAIGGEITFDGYSIQSPSGSLNPADGAWQSLADNAVGAWLEANPNNTGISELNPDSSSTLEAGTSFGLGTPFVPPTQFGVDNADLTFDYGVPGGPTVSGIIEYTGLHNTMVLLVDPATGEAALENQSEFSAAIDAYIITSESGQLLPNGWGSFEDSANPAGWFEANPTAFNLSELNPTASTLIAGGQRFALGSPFMPDGIQDLTLLFSLADGTKLDGVVQYGPIGPTGQIGDTNGDRLVNIDDLNNVRNNFGAMGAPDGTLAGDAFPFDGLVNIDDLNGVRNNFGAGPAPVPEPAAFCLLALGFCLTISCAARRR